jgi:hypothetical protein
MCAMSNALNKFRSNTRESAREDLRDEYHNHVEVHLNHEPFPALARATSQSAVTTVRSQAGDAMATAVAGDGIEGGTHADDQDRDEDTRAMRGPRTRGRNDGFDCDDVNRIDGVRRAHNRRK